MNAKIFCTSVLYALAVVSSGQTDQLNQLDSNGKKDGKWMVYLDSDWKKTSDSTEAVYCRYTWYDHGTDIHAMGAFGGKWKLEPAGENLQKGKMKLLDGEYKWKDAKGHTGFILVLKKGDFVSYKQFDESGKLSEHFDYTKHWQDQAHSYCIYMYDKKGDSQCYFMSKGKHGWMGYASNADSAATEISKVTGDSTFATARYYKGGKLIRKTGEISIKEADGRMETILHGPTASWYLNGQKKEEGAYYYGKKTGPWKHWDENGNLER